MGQKKTLKPNYALIIDKFEPKNEIKALIVLGIMRVGQKIEPRINYGLRINQNGSENESKSML